MIKRFIILLLIIVSQSVAAVIYKSVDQDGNVIYTDESSLGAEEIPDPTPNTVTLPKPSPESEIPKSGESAETRYTSLRVITPAADETIRSNPGLLTIKLDLKPALDVKAGHAVSLLVDGYVLVRKSSQLSMQIPDISRGTHRLQALITDQQGQVLIKSALVQFFMQRQSLLNKPGASRVGPLDTAGKPIHPGPQGTYFVPGPVTTPTAADNSH